MFITMVTAKWDGAQNKLVYVNAGHERVLQYTAATKQVVELEKGGIALGLFPNAILEKKLEERDIPMAKGDFIVFYSDGAPEAWRNEKEVYGMERLKKAVIQHAPLGSSEAIKQALFTSVTTFMAGYEQKDDITLMIVQKT
jgi:phosphoserine phosphatase RsbU/P